MRFGLAFELKQRSPISQNADNSTSKRAMKKSEATSPPSASTPLASTTGNMEVNDSSISKTQAYSTTLSVLFQDVYPGYEAFKKIYRACAAETDIN